MYKPSPFSHDEIRALHALWVGYQEELSHKPWEDWKAVLCQETQVEILRSRRGRRQRYESILGKLMKLSPDDVFHTCMYADLSIKMVG